MQTAMSIIPVRPMFVLVWRAERSVRWDLVKREAEGVRGMSDLLMSV
jgi:hypothetical protein